MKNAIVIAFVEVVAVEFDSFDPCMETEITAKNLNRLYTSVSLSVFVISLLQRKGNVF